MYSSLNLILFCLLLLITFKKITKVTDFPYYVAHVAYFSLFIMLMYFSFHFCFVLFLFTPLRLELIICILLINYPAFWLIFKVRYVPDDLPNLNARISVTNVLILLVEFQLRGSLSDLIRCAFGTLSREWIVWIVWIECLWANGYVDRACGPGSSGTLGLVGRV